MTMLYLFFVLFCQPVVVSPATVFLAMYCASGLELLYSWRGEGVSDLNGCDYSRSPDVWPYNGGIDGMHYGSSGGGLPCHSISSNVLCDWSRVIIFMAWRRS